MAWRGEANLQRIAVQAGDFGALFAPGCTWRVSVIAAPASRSQSTTAYRNISSQLREDDGDQRRQVDGANRRYDTLDRAQEWPRQLRHGLAQGRVGTDPRQDGLHHQRSQSAGRC
jgi:hypothetical protein